MKYLRTSELAAIAAMIRVNQQIVIDKFEEGNISLVVHDRQQFIMDERCFHDIAAVFAIATSEQPVRNGSTIKYEQSDPLTYTFYFSCIKLTMKYEKNLGGCFCIVDEHIDEQLQAIPTYH